MKLLAKIRRTCCTKHLSIRTEKAYIRWALRFVRYHGTRHPRELAEAEVRDFLTYLAVERHVAAATQNQALAALLFLYAHVLERPLGDLGPILRANWPKQLPLVLTRTEVKSILSQLQEPHHLVASLLYGSGLRLLESLRLRVKDVGFSYSQITVRDGKGQFVHHWRWSSVMVFASLTSSVIRISDYYPTANSWPRTTRARSIY